MTALDLLMAGRAEEAIQVLRRELADDPEDIATVDGLAHAYMDAGRYEEAIPLKWRLHEAEKIPDSPGQLHYLSCAYWCRNDRPRGIELAQELCDGVLKGTVNMAPDIAGGATFGLLLHYMAVTAGNDSERDYAVRYLQKLNSKYGKHPHRYLYPKHSVKQLLGQMSFEDALEGATDTQEEKTATRDLAMAYRVAESSRSIKMKLGQVLFHDGAIRRAQGDEAGCMKRMKEVFALGYQTESIRWYLARHEVTGR